MVLEWQNYAPGSCASSRGPLETEEKTHAHPIERAVCRVHSG